MHASRRLYRGIALFMSAILFSMSLPVNAARAGLVKTEEVIEKSNAQGDRDRVKDFLEREEVRDQLTSLGIAPEEATRRVDALSNAEVAQIAGYIDQTPAGQGAVGAIVGAILIIFLVLLITDLLGLTDIFPFVKSQKK